MADRHPRMILSTEGEEGSGKSRLALTAPRPMTWLDWDFGLEGVDGAAPEVHHTYDLLAAEWMNDAQALKHTQDLMHKFIADFRQALKDKMRTVVADTFSTAWKGQRIARADDTYAEMEEEFMGLIRAAYASPYTNVILIHHMKIDWKRNKEGKPYPGDTKSRDGMDGVANAVQLAIRQRYIRPIPAQMAGAYVTQQAVPGRFEADVLKCRDNVGLVGQTLTNMDFPTLCTLACPSVDWTK